jgi:cardiolipin synthase
VNLPNFITVCRVVAIPVIVALLAYEHRTAAFAVFLAAGLSDALDGFLARILDQRTVLGTFLDPMADKLLATTCFVAAAVFGLAPIWLVIIVISRDIIIILGALVVYLITGGLTIIPLPLGKATTFFQFITIGALLAHPVIDLPGNILTILFAATALLSVASGAQYIHEGLRLTGDHE